MFRAFRCHHCLVRDWLVCVAFVAVVLSSCTTRDGSEERSAPEQVSPIPAQVSGECVATGNQVVEVPDVVGLPLMTAIDKVRDAGLTVIGTGTPPNDPIEETAIVRAHEPPAGIKVPLGACVGFRTNAGSAVDYSAAEPGPNATPEPDDPPTTSLPAGVAVTDPQSFSEGVRSGGTHLNVGYRDCLLEQGFDPEGVQVIVDGAGVPWWVKTGHNVPGGLHGYCLEAIGGAPTSNTSYGVPIDNRPDLATVQLTCGTVTFDDWNVALDQYLVFEGELPQPVRDGFGVSADSDGSWLDGVSWREVARLQNRLLLLGERSESEARRYTFAELAKVDDEWVGSAWGNCSLRLQAKGWESTSLATNPDEVFTPESTTITLHATERACASGQPPGTRDIVELIKESDDAVYVAVFVEKQWSPTGTTCPDNPVFTARIRLKEPLGDRVLVDISTYPHTAL